MFPEKIPGSSVVKNTVRAAFSGRYINTAAAALMPVFAFYMIMLLASCLLLTGFKYSGLISVAILILTAFFLGYPLFLGSVRYFWRLTDGINEGPAEVFYYFSSLRLYKRAIKSALLLTFKFLTAFIPSMLPYYITVLFSNAWIYRFLGTEIPLWVAGLALLSAFLYYAGIFIGAVIFMRYYLFCAVVAMDDDLLIYEAAHISTMISSRSIGAFAALIVSILGWILLSLLIAPMVYTAPFIMGCYAVHCRYAIVNYNMTLDFHRNSYEYEKE